jgi:hypothetical protein
MGSLYVGAANAPDPCALLLKVEVSASLDCNLTVAGNVGRGKAVLEGASQAQTNLPITIAVAAGGPPPCYTGPDVTAWNDVNQPSSWCYADQCHGDADGATEVMGRATVQVGYNDIAILLAGFGEAYSGDPTVDGPDDDSDPDTWIAADFDHATETMGRATVRVGYNDITVLLAYFGDDYTTMPGDCQTGSPVSP